MDMKIAGSGVITAGEYEGISVSGSARMDGVVICEKLKVLFRVRRLLVKRNSEFRENANFLRKSRQMRCVLQVRFPAAI